MPIEFAPNGSSGAPKLSVMPPVKHCMGSGFTIVPRVILAERTSVPIKSDVLHAKANIKIEAVIGKAGFFQKRAHYITKLFCDGCRRSGKWYIPLGCLSEVDAIINADEQRNQISKGV